MFKKAYIILFLAFLVNSCGETPTGTTPLLSDNFDRQEMLQFWAEDMIIPGYTEYNHTLQALRNQAGDFFLIPTMENLSLLRSAWLNAYMTWQDVSMFDIGKAEEIGLVNFTNIYPADTELINAHISTGDYNLELPSNFSAQGFPALDYLLFGAGIDEDEIIAYLSAEATEAYVLSIIDRLQELTTEVLSDWNDNFKESFITNSGSSGTASTDKLINDFLFFYEKHLRAAKIGMPAGVFSGDTESELVEAKYAGIYSKQLFLRAFSATQNFFKGISYDGQAQGKSLQQYLTSVHTSNNTDIDFSESILAQWEKVTENAEALNDNFQDQIMEDNSKMLAVYDELNKAVVLMKVDMMQALNIQVDFIDADGD